MRQRLWWVLATAALLEACFAPDYQNGKTACSPAGECPSDFQCIAGLCYKTVEGPMDLSTAPDLAVEIDGGPDLLAFPDLANGCPPGGTCKKICIYDQDNYDSDCIYAP